MSPDATRAPSITAQEFAEEYAARGFMTLREMAELFGDRREVAPCDCDYEGCEGWQMRNPEFREPWDAPGVSLAELV